MESSKTVDNTFRPKSSLVIKWQSAHTVLTVFSFVNLCSLVYIAVTPNANNSMIWAFLISLSVLSTSLLFLLNLIFKNTNELLPEQIQQNEKLFQDLIQFRQALDNSAIVAMTDTKGKILSVNDTFCQISGYSKEELLGQNHRILNSGVHPKQFFKDMWQSISSGKPWYGEITNRNKNGDLYYVSTVITPLKNSAGIIDRYLSIRFDISSKVATEKNLEIERTKSILNSKLAALGEMSAGIGHEINNPLSVIMGTLPSLERYKNDPMKFEAKISLLTRSSERISKIVKSLKKFSRSSEPAPAAPEKIADIVNEVLVMTESKLNLFSTTISIDIQTEARVICDFVEIEQVILNIINNGVDAIKDLPEKWVKIALFEDHKTVVLQIIDSGAGISKELEEKIFQPFFTTKPVGEGTGLGLSISKSLVEQHKGSLKINRTFKNTCFEIRFPIYQESADAA